MSLSFVASAVQTATADGGFEETKIESKQVDAINQRNAHKPLFEQLRQNQEEEQAKQEEIQREMMRGTRALDDEDVAHLDALEKHRQERERIIQQRTQEELMLFRAARAVRQQGSLDGNESEGSIEDHSLEIAPVGPHKPTLPPPTPQDTSQNPPLGPKLIIVKKRKRKNDLSKGEELEKNRSRVKEPKEKDDDDEGPKDVNLKSLQPNDKLIQPVGSLGGLLSGYGSSDDDSARE